MKIADWVVVGGIVSAILVVAWLFAELTMALEVGL